MKCVCPMGGDRTCPDDCPLAVWWAMTPERRKKKTARKPIVEQLANQGFTQQAIATQLGVTQSTIHGDLEGLSILINPPRPRGGRPRGRREPTPRQRQNVPRDATIHALRDQGLSDAEIAPEVGISPRRVGLINQQEGSRREGYSEAYEDAFARAATEALSASSKKKLEAAIRLHKKELDRTYNQRMMAANRAHWDRLFPDMQKKQNDASHVKQLYEKFLRESRKIFTVNEYKSILMVLHPDGERSQQKRSEAFRLFNAKRFAMTGEQEALRARAAE